MQAEVAPTTMAERGSCDDRRDLVPLTLKLRLPATECEDDHDRQCEAAEKSKKTGDDTGENVIVVTWYIDNVSHSSIDRIRRERACGGCRRCETHVIGMGYTPHTHDGDD